MATFIVGLLTLILVLDCIVLVFLVLIQLPKKEAGAGLAFGGATSDALFGAGSGNVLTKITKYAAIIFFVLSILLSLLFNRLGGRKTGFEQKLMQPGGAPVSTLPATPATPPAVPPASNNVPAAEEVPPATAPSTAPATTNPAPATK
jgi:preprotein translocase subunit SecG